MRRLSCGVLLLVTACDHGVPATPAPAPRAAPSVTASAAAQITAVPFAPEKLSHEAKVMGTHLTLTAFTTQAVGPDAVHAAFVRATDEIRRLESLMTTWKPDSELSRVNAEAAKKPIAVSQETFEVIQESLRTSEISQGTFDITFESLHGLWKFDEDWDPHPPAAKDVKAKLPLVHYQHVRLDPAARTVSFAKDGVKISLGGIAKGYAVDKAVKVLDEAGLTSFFVQAGGDLFARGKKPDGSEWQTGIRDPRSAGYFAVLPLSDHAFSTAGDYERFYLIGDKRYHHIIDPRTGQPATACRSVTIWATSAFVADAIDDAVFILGPEKGMRLVESIDGVGAVIVDAKNNLWVSQRLKGKLVVTAVPSDGP